MTLKDFLGDSEIFEKEGSVEQMEVVLDEIQKLSILTNHDWYIVNHNGWANNNRKYFFGGAAFSAAIALAIYGCKKVKNSGNH